MPPYQPPRPIESPDFLQQFMAGFGMAHQQREQARRDELMRQEQAREDFDRQMRQEHLKLTKQEIDLRLKKAQADDKVTQWQRQQDANNLQGQLAQLPPPTAAESGVQQAVPDVGPDVSQINMAQPTATLPSETGAAPDVQMPLATGKQMNLLAQLMADQKRREEERKRSEGIADYRTKKGIDREMAPPEKGPQGSWVEAVGPDGKPILFNSTTGQAKPYPAGVTPKTTGAGAIDPNFGSAKSEGERKGVEMAQYAVGKMPSWQAFVKENEGMFGPIAGRATKFRQSGLGEALGMKPSGEVAKKQAEFAIMRNGMINALSGAAVSPQEYERLKEQVPDLTDHPTVVESKFRVLDDYFRSKLGNLKAAIPGGQTASPAGGTDDPPPQP